MSAEDVAMCAKVAFISAKAAPRCATGATIVSGSLAERAKLEGYCIFSFFMCLFIYPIVVHWTWGGGWLYV